MNLFTSTDAKLFEQQVTKYGALMTEERLAKEEVIKKKQYV